MNILLTGASGFIGRNLAQLLVDKQYSVVSIGRNAANIAGIKDVILPTLDFHEIDNVLSEHKVDVIFHLAAAGVKPQDRNDIEVMRVNAFLPGIITNLAAKYKVKAVVIAGTSSEYKATTSNKKLSESSELETEKLYGASKAAGSILALSQGTIHALPVAVVRMFNVFGPGEAEHRLLPSLIDSLNHNKEVKLSLGTQVRDFVYIDDVCAGLLSVMNALLDSASSRGVFNLSTGIGHSVADFALTAARLIDADEKLLKFGALPFRPDDAPYVVGDFAALNNMCGWKAEFTMKDGIAAAIEQLHNKYIKAETN